MNLNFFWTLAVVVSVAFAVTFWITPRLIRRMEKKKFVSQDMNKADKPLVVKFGGAALFIGFILAVLIGLQLRSTSIQLLFILGAIAATTLITFLGLLDDLLDVPDRYKVVIPAFAALPLMATKAGVGTFNLIFFTLNVNFGTVMLPLLGPITLNLYPLLFVPVGVVAVSNLFNLLGGFNGLEAGVGAIVAIAMLAVAGTLYLQGYPGTVESGLLMAALFGACMAFLIFNWYPAKTFPGNITTFLIGAAVVSAVVIGNFERAGLIAVIPQIAEFFLKARSRFQAENFGKVDKDGRLHYDGPVYSLTHFLMNRFAPTEPELVKMLLVIQAVFGVLAYASIWIH